MSDIFGYQKNFFGGTEKAAMWFKKNVFPECPKFSNYRCILIPGLFPENILSLFDGRENILWLQLFPYQIEGIPKDIFYNAFFEKTVRHVIVPSHYHKKNMIEQSIFPEEKIIVIENAIEKNDYDIKKFENVEKIKIIHASNPERGLQVLLKSIKNIEEDFELNIFNDFYPDLIENSEFKKLFEDPRINFFGKTPNKTVLKFFSEAHIHAYPSTYEETSCLTQIEALSSGCYCVYSNIGALPETSKNYGKCCDFSSFDEQTMIHNFTEGLQKAIEIIKNKKFDPHYQVEDVFLKHSPSSIKNKWLKFHEKI
jgi:glycosyltransferase involved in cell wall biosynthesis